jgi:3D (Asp-Asp-Asp) domain-containing protein
MKAKEFELGGKSVLITFFLMCFLFILISINAKQIPDQVYVGQGVLNTNDAHAETKLPVRDYRSASLGPQYVKVKTVRAIVTAYCPCSKCCGVHANGRTALNDDAWVCDGVAVDFNLIPRRWWVLIPGVGLKEADDTGGAMRQAGKRGIYHIDLRFANHQQALNWGRREMEIEIYRPKT